MALPTLQPISKTSKSILSVTGSTANVTTSSLPFAVYLSEDHWTSDQIELFKKGAAEQVSYVYKKLGGDVLDIEIVEQQVYAAYEEATLEYSYILNLHQSKNSLSKALGGAAGTFDEKGRLTGSNAADLSHTELKFPKFTLAYAQRVAQGYSGIVDLNGTETTYSGSFTVQEGKQDYDIQAIISASAAAGGVPYSGLVGNKRINIKKMYYKTPAASWNFYGYFGGLNVVGNLSTYGQYADDSTFEIVPAWQNKLQAMAYEDALKTRVSDWSYQIRNNKIRIFPTPQSTAPLKMWFLFTIPSDAFSDDNEGAATITAGINNVNTLPFENIPYDKINSMGKQWIRRFCLSLCKEMLGQIRSKFGTIPIPGETVTLNGPALISDARAEMKELRDELVKLLDETTYDKLLEKDAAMAETTSKALNYAPNLIFVG
jgi:hypothetical protein